jgi:hypothetical protein
MSGHVASTKLYYGVFLALLIGTGLTYAAALVDFGLSHEAARRPASCRGRAC